MASITYDNATYSQEENGPNSMTFSHTVGSSSNRLLLVGVIGSTRQIPMETVSCTYGGVSMTVLVSTNDQYNSGTYTALFGLLNPTPGTADVVVTLANNFSIYATAVSYYNVKQTGLPDSYTTNIVTASSTTDTLTTSADNCWTFLVAGTGLGGSYMSSGTGSTIRGASNNTYRGACFDSNGPKTPAGSTSMSASAATSTSIISAMVSFAPFTAWNAVTNAVTSWTAYVVSTTNWDKKNTGQ